MLRTDLPIHGIDSPDVIGVGNEQGRFLRRGATETLADSMKGGFGPDIYFSVGEGGPALAGHFHQRARNFWRTDHSL